MRVGARMARLCSRIPLPPRRIPRRSAASPMNFTQLHKECDEFLSWLKQKAGHEISSVLSVGISIYGRSLFASRSIQAGECILKVPYSAQIMSNKILPEIESLLSGAVGNVSRLAVVLLAEKRIGQDSEWAPYINSLPCISEMHNTVFWSENELEMVRHSPVHDETFNQKAYIEMEFSALKSALDHFPQFFGDCRFEDFMHAYALVVSRAWGTSKGVSLIPFADFLNHDGVSEAVLLCDEDKENSEVISDRNYAAGEQVLIRYGKFSNATLMLDFGFTLPYNIYDQVQIWIEIPSDDPLYMTKMELLCEHCLPTMTNLDGFNSSRSTFIIKEVKSASGKGKGIPQALRAYARILSTTCNEELKALATEAAENDGRLARRPLKNKNSEIQAHHILLLRFRDMIHGRVASIKALESSSVLDISDQLVCRRQMAMDLLRGELRVLRSACTWLRNYCAGLSAASRPHARQKNA